jgi:tRNA-specific 2-thiouridylase
MVAMSGGVDSSVAAALLRDAGHEVTGVTLKLWGGVSDSGCCSISDVEDARRVARSLGVEHHVFNYTREFDVAVVEPFIADHAAGLTPNPCIECNRVVKFDLLIERARRLGFDALATGHHARVIPHDGEQRLARGHDDKKDQSYVLGYLSREALDFLMLPLGDMTKVEVREHATRLNLATAAKPDSQDVCFIEASAGREAFLGSRIPLRSARVVDRPTGRELGELPAVELVTLGQRRGVAPGIDGQRRYVADVDVSSGVVLVDSLESILVNRVCLDGESEVFPFGRPQHGEAVIIQASAHGKPLQARFDAHTPALDFLEPVRPIAPGQSVVIYDEANFVVRGAARVAR